MRANALARHRRVDAAQSAINSGADNARIHWAITAIHAKNRLFRMFSPVGKNCLAAPDSGPVQAAAPSSRQVFASRHGNAVRHERAGKTRVNFNEAGSC
jgi:hypothetical protein